MDFVKTIKVGARESNLSKAQVLEVLSELRHFDPHVCFEPVWVKTRGDKDLFTSLRLLDKTDFFTREIDQMLLNGSCRIAVHSAKDLPFSLPSGIALAALTRGVDSTDVLVMRQGDSLEGLPSSAVIGTSCERRDAAVKKLRPDLKCVDIRGTIERRLSILDLGQVDGVVMAEAALIRLNLTWRNRIRLDAEVAPLQGRLAVLARQEDLEMAELFALLDAGSDALIK